MVGKTILQYQILEKLGTGGMGEIYKAQDTRLNRMVAIKVLPASMSDDPDRRRRFLQEAQAASALNHPNIITIHDIVSEDGTQYMVMEFVPGKTLNELTPPEGLPVSEALGYGIQMADALAAAHAAGIIHRDLKPANVMVTSGGRVKLLDFGLAKLTANPLSLSGDADTTVDGPLTQVGSLVGTFSYMSPEQAEGRVLDTRSDIFSFGSVLYEMVTGHRAFQGDSGISTLSAVLRDDAKPLLQAAPSAPPELQQVVLRAMSKNPDERWQSMHDLHAALTQLKSRLDSGFAPAVAMPEPKPANSKALVWGGVAAVVVLVVVVGAWWAMGYRDTPAPVVEAPIEQAPALSLPPEGAVLTNDNILEMVQAKVAPSVLVSQIKASKAAFDLSPSEVIRLTRGGVPPGIIDWMHDTSKAEPVFPVAVNTPAASSENSASRTAAKPAAQPVSIADGQPLKLALTQDLPADAQTGLVIALTVTDDVISGNFIVISKGAAASGVVAQAARKKILGIGGKMMYRLLQVEAIDGQKIALRATPAKRADGDTKRPVETVGKSKSKDVVAAAGSEFTGYVDGAHAVLVK